MGLRGRLNLLGELEEDEVVYCSPPAGYETKKLTDGSTVLCAKGDGDGVARLCKVEKPMYGMAQAGRRWQRSLSPWLLDWRCDAKGAKGLRTSSRAGQRRQV